MVWIFLVNDVFGYSNLFFEYFLIFMDNGNEIFEVNDELYVREVLLVFGYFYFGIIFRNIGRSMV